MEDLACHGLRVSLLDTRETQHADAVAAQRFPELLLDFGFVSHDLLLGEPVSVPAGSAPGRRRARTIDVRGVNPARLLS
jgi:hypothetical protein